MQVKLWAVSDGAAGNARQASALAQSLARRLDAEAESVVVVGRYPWRAAAPRMLHGALRHFDPTFVARCRAERPGIVVGCGRVAALATRLAREIGMGDCRAVQILDPRLPGPYWDVRVVPAHDSYRDARTVVCLGSLHPVDDAWLEHEAQTWSRCTDDRAPPGVAVLLGGPTRRARWTLRDVQDWMHRTATWPEAGGGTWVVGSRRTPVPVRRWLRGQTELAVARLWLDQGDGPNPYAAALALAKRIVVSPDSVNMLSEAAATRASLHVPGAASLKGRQQRFVEALRCVRTLHGLDDPITEAAPEPWRELPAVTDQVVALLGLL